jgi:hypothetical protein
MLWIGFISSSVILFKAVGLPLLLVGLVKIVRERRFKSFFLVVVGGLIPLLISFLLFGTEFIEPLTTRLNSQSNVEPLHDSLWRLFPNIFQYQIYFFIAFLLIGLFWSFVIATNFRLTFLTLWLSLALVIILFVSGSWDRQMMGLLPVYLVVFALQEKIRAIIVLQSVLISSFYYWEVWLGRKLNLSLEIENIGPLASLLSVLFLIMTAFYDVSMHFYLRKQRVN